MNQNPFNNSDTNLRYYSYSYYLKKTYGKKVYKVPLDAGFTCPNRDGTCGIGGCSFCSSEGSGEYAGNYQDDLNTQFEDASKQMERKWPNALKIAYFQAYTNTYASLDKLKEIYQPILDKKDLVAIAFATRPDCLDDDKISYFQSLTSNHDIWIELGLQTIHDKTALQTNRGHTYQTLKEVVEKLKKTDIKICLHIINGLYDENSSMMLQTAKEVARLNVDAIKIHMLHIMEDALIAKEYKKNPFNILSLEQYVSIVCDQLEVLPPNMIIQRLTGDAQEEKLITPKWTLKKTIVLNEIQKELVRRNSYQGKYYTSTI